jgi:hypothetical protein
MAVVRPLVRRWHCWDCDVAWSGEPGCWNCGSTAHMEVDPLVHAEMDLDYGTP